MYSIKKSNIELTRGDTLVLQVVILKDGEAYTPAAEDEIRFAMKHNTLNGTKTEYTDPEPLLTKVIPNDTMILRLESNDTKPFGFGLYAYDIQITFEDGTVDTFIIGTLKLTEEVY